METFKRAYNMKDYAGGVNFYFFGDVHEGNCNKADKLFKKAVKIIDDDPCGRWFGMGDYIEAITINDKKRFDASGIHEKYRVKDLKNLPIKQADEFLHDIEPIFDKCEGIIIGNHEATCSKYNSVDVYKHIIKEVARGDEDRMKQLTLGMIAIGIINLHRSKTSRISFKMYLNHGDGGTGFLYGYPLNKLMELFRYSMADVNIMGHVHQLEIGMPKFNDVKWTKSDLCVFNKIRRVFGVSGTFLETYVDGNANYFEHKGRREGDIGMLKINVSIDRKHASVIDTNHVEYKPEKIILG